MSTINAKMRKEQGKSTSCRLHATNRFPAIIYGDAEAPIAIELDHNAAMSMQAKTEFYSGVLAIVVDGREVKVKAQAVQHRPFKPKLSHIDFARV